ncbi:hypothetical protein NQ315_008849 [Exocentrus adspersus]|uniref:Large ribosomal subunit protein bL28m n=1 Tax=Exocentrus adspersus TaxID=1586481 RepID=A0AAV8VDQ6_9CUCU|nr:hypothetical protein NQ315_008849 [Exocentrus adspersus]
MASKSVKTLGIFQKPTLFNKGIGALLPEAYKKFYKEWRFTEPTAVHYVPEPGRWKRDEVTGQVLPVQNVPIPLMYPKEHNNQMWGGEGIIQGFYQEGYQRRVPRFWLPILKRTVVYSEVLNKYMSVIVTNRTIDLINSNYGFDHYLLKTPACDLKSLLPLKLKRKVLQELQEGCPTYADQPEKQKEILKRYQSYLAAYTPEEIKWYGYSYTEACKMLRKQMSEQVKVVPLKQVYRSQLIEKLKAEKIEAASASSELEESGSWLRKINPFGKKHET